MHNAALWCRSRRRAWQKLCEALFGRFCREFLKTCLGRLSGLFLRSPGGSRRAGLCVEVVDGLAPPPHLFNEVAGLRGPPQFQEQKQRKRLGTTSHKVAGLTGPPGPRKTDQGSAGGAQPGRRGFTSHCRAQQKTNPAELAVAVRRPMATGRPEQKGEMSSRGYSCCLSGVAAGGQAWACDVGFWCALALLGLGFVMLGSGVTLSCWGIVILVRLPG